MCTVTFKDGDGSDFAYSDVIAGNPVILDAADEPTKASSGDYDYTFNGNWYTTPELDDLWDLENDVVNHHMTLYPEFDATYKGLFAYTLDEDTMTAKITGLNSAVAAEYTDTVASIPDVIKSGTKTYAVTSIAERAFQNVALPDSVTIVSFNDADHLVSIGDYAFYNGSAASYAVGKLPDSITYVGRSAFYQVKTTSNALYGSLLDLRNTLLTEIKDYAFASLGAHIAALFTLPESVTKIGSYAFYNSGADGECPDLSHVTYFGSYAFYGCYHLTGVADLSGTKSIPNYFFHGGPALANLDGIILNEETTTIGANAFYNQRKLVSVTGTSSLTSIGEQAFNGCPSIKSFFIPATCTTIGQNAFSYSMAADGIIYCAVPSDLYNWAANWHSNFYGTILYNAIASGSYEYSANATIDYIIRPDESLVITGYTGTETSLNLRLGMEIDGKTYFVQEIGAEAFRNNTSLTSIYILTAKRSNDPLVIGDYAFAGCTNLVNFYVNGANGYWGQYLYLSVGAHAFDGDVKVNFTPMVPSGGAYAFKGLYLLSIGEYAFAGCIAFTRTVTIQNNVGAHAFEGCTKLAGFNLKATNTTLTIGEYAFNECTEIAKAEILANWKVESYAFNGCTGLTSAWIKSGAIMSGNWIFCSVGNGLTIHCNDASAPDTWGENWNYNALGVVHSTSYGDTSF